MTEVLTYEALKAKHDALAVENAALKDACGGDGSYRDCPACAHSQYIESPETPTTSEALAAIQARAKAEAFAEIIEFIDRRSGLAEMKTQWDLSSAIVAHIAELREAK